MAVKPAILSDRTKTTKTRTLKLKVGKFFLTETYINNKLTHQSWSVEGGFEKTHPTAYEPKNLHFQYYDDISFLKSENCSNYISFHDEVPESSFIIDWSKFKGFNHLLCVWLGMDGCIYRIDKPNPVKLWRHQDYTDGFGNDKYNLDKVMKKLKRKSWIRNVEIVEIPYYNQEESLIHAVEFDYRLSSKRELKTKLEKDFPDHYFVY